MSGRAPDALTVITAPRLWLAKRISPKKTEQYSRARHLDFATVPINGLDDIAVALTRLARDPHSAVIRGELIDPRRSRGVRRLLYPDPETGEAPTCREVSRQWVALDLEKIERPADVDVTDLAACARVALASLPAAFRDVRAVVQATSSHGIKPDIRLRIWCWLSRPTTGEELKRWLAGTPADPAVFGGVQPIYTAAPIFAGGTVDHLPRRMAELPGVECVEVPPPEALAPPPRPARPTADPHAPVSASAIEAFIDRCLARVRNAGDGGKHAALRAAAVSLGGIQDQAGFSDSEMTKRLLDAAAAPRSRAKDAATAAWGLDRGRARPLSLPERKPYAPRIAAATRVGKAGNLPTHAHSVSLPEPEPPEAWEDARPVSGDEAVAPPRLEDLPPARKPNTTMEAHRALMEVGVEAWIAGEGPAHIINGFATGTQKNRIPITLFAKMAKARRADRRQFIWEHQLKNRGPDGRRGSYADAAQAADEAGLRKLRVCMVVGDHGLAKQHRELADSLGMIAASDAGLDRHVDPTDPQTEPLCSQHKRVELTRRAGEPVRKVACGIDLNRPHCIDREGCPKWEQIGQCERAEFVTIMADRATGHHMPHELHGFDYLIIDDPPDRMFFQEHEFKLDLLDDHLLRDKAPVLREDLDENLMPTWIIDEEATEDARVLYARLRTALGSLSNGYNSWNRAALDAAGCTVDFFTLFTDLSDRRLRPTGMTAATPDEEREAMARGSFRNAVRAICAFGRLAGAIQAGTEGEGRIELTGDAPRIALLRPRPRLHPSLLAARIMICGAGLDTDLVRRLVPDAQPMDGADGIPEAPNQTLVHMHVGTGAHAMRSKERQRFAQALVKLEGDTSRPGATGVLSLMANEDLFVGLPGVITGHHGAVVGRGNFENTTTFFGFGARFLPPKDAAALGAADTGEQVPVEQPVRQYRRIPMRWGRDVVLPTMDYEHPAAAAANRRVRDFDILQGVLARPRATNRTADNPVLTFNIGTAIPDGCEVDHLIIGWKDYAPQRMVTAWAEKGYLTEHSLGRHLLHPTIYEQPWSGQNDRQRLEVGGFKATVLRMITPPWRFGPTEPVVFGRLWRSGHAYREEGEPFFATMRQLQTFMAEARRLYGATRFVVDENLWPDRPITDAELSIIPKSEDEGDIIDSSDDAMPWPPVGPVVTTCRVEHPPDG